MKRGWANRPKLPPAEFKVHCDKHGAQMVPRIAPVGPTLTRPQLPVFDRLPWKDSERLYSATPGCDHYITYGVGGGVRCIRKGCRGWFCS